MQATAKLSDYRQAPRKVRLVADLAFLGLKELLTGGGIALAGSGGGRKGGDPTDERGERK